MTVKALGLGAGAFALLTKLASGIRKSLGGSLVWAMPEGSWVGQAGVL